MNGRLQLAAVVLTLCSCLHVRPASDEKIEATPARLERGAYLARSALACTQCHSEPDEGVFGMPPREGTEGLGGHCFDESVGVPGRVCAPSLGALSAWSDGEVMRAIREGIGRDGRGLFPIMPYRDYAALSDEDTRAIVAYLRTLPAVDKPVPEKQLNFPVGIFIRAVPRPLEGPVPEPKRADEVAYGRYLGKVCVRCHSPADWRGRTIAGTELSGGLTFTLRSGAKVVSANLTPHGTGLAGWSRDQFVARFKSTVPAAVTPAQNTVMPWQSFAALSEDDLSAIYAWLRTVPAIERRVVTRP